MKFGQNKSCRGKDDLQLSFWAKVDLRLELGRKTRSNVAKSMFTMQTRLMLMMLINLNYQLSMILALKLTPGCYSPSPLKESRPEIQARENIKGEKVRRRSTWMSV